MSDKSAERSSEPARRIAHVGLVAKWHLRAAAPHLANIIHWLAERDVQATCETATGALLAGEQTPRVADYPDLVRQVDMILVLGGDGTLLGAADQVAAAGADIPILGVNFGSLGFLTEVTLPELYPSLEAAISGRAPIERRMMLQSTIVRNGQSVASHVALNDVVVKAGHVRIMTVLVSAGDEFVTRLKADGLIVATPTGSTAYNLAAGGPIVEPDVPAIVLTPIAPHTLTYRPIVIPATSPVRIQPLMNERDEVVVTFDGQASCELRPSDEVLVHGASHGLRLVRPSTRSYYEVLRQKLKWGDY